MVRKSDCVVTRCETSNSGSGDGHSDEEQSSAIRSKGQSISDCGLAYHSLVRSVARYWARFSPLDPPYHPSGLQREDTRRITSEKVRKITEILPRQSSGTAEQPKPPNTHRQDSHLWPECTGEASDILERKPIWTRPKQALRL